MFDSLSEKRHYKRIPKKGAKPPSQPAVLDSLPLPSVDQQTQELHDLQRVFLYRQWGMLPDKDRPSTIREVSDHQCTFSCNPLSEGDWFICPIRCQFHLCTPTECKLMVEIDRAVVCPLSGRQFDTVTNECHFRGQEPSTGGGGGGMTMGSGWDDEGGGVEREVEVEKKPPNQHRTRRRVGRSQTSNNNNDQNRVFNLIQRAEKISSRTRVDTPATSTIQDINETAKLIEQGRQLLNRILSLPVADHTIQQRQRLVIQWIKGRLKRERSIDFLSIVEYNGWVDRNRFNCQTISGNSHHRLSQEEKDRLIGQATKAFVDISNEIKETGGRKSDRCSYNAREHFVVYFMLAAEEKNGVVEWYPNLRLPAKRHIMASEGIVSRTATMTENAFKEFAMSRNFLARKKARQ